MRCYINSLFWCCHRFVLGMILMMNQEARMTWSRGAMEEKRQPASVVVLLAPKRSRKARTGFIKHGQASWASSSFGNLWLLPVGYYYTNCMVGLPGWLTGRLIDWWTYKRTGRPTGLMVVILTCADQVRWWSHSWFSPEKKHECASSKPMHNISLTNGQMHDFMMQHLYHCLFPCLIFH